MTYVQAQEVTQKIVSDKNADPELSFKAMRPLDKCYDQSMGASKWEPCEDPKVGEFGYWQKGMPVSSYPRKDGSRMTWRWIQPKTENYIYCFTETRQPIPNDPDGKWETINTVSRKPLTLTPEAEAFFKSLQLI